jgi:hypothetical protein
VIRPDDPAACWGWSAALCCDVRSCTNPQHLFLGTKADNNDDKIAKGRQPRGTAHHWAKLTQAQAELIRVIRSAYGTSMQNIAEQFGISRALVSLVLANKIWVAA